MKGKIWVKAVLKEVLYHQGGLSLLYLMMMMMEKKKNCIDHHGVVVSTFECGSGQGYESRWILWGVFCCVGYFGWQKQTLASSVIILIILFA